MPSRRKSVRKKSVKRRSLKKSVRRSRKKSVKRRSLKKSVRRSRKKSVKKSLKKSVKKSLKKSVRKSRKKSVKKSVRSSKKGVKFGVQRISNCNPLEPTNIQTFLNVLNTDLLEWGRFLHTSGYELIDQQHYYTYFYNIKGTTEDRRENSKNNNSEESKVDKYFDTYIDPKIFSMSTEDLKQKISKLVTIHKKIWKFLITIDRCEKTHTKKSPNKDVCFSNQNIFFPPPIIQEVFFRKDFFEDKKEKRNYLVNYEAYKIKSVFYKGDGSDEKMYKKRGLLKGDYYLYDNVKHTFSEKSDNGIFGKSDYHTICIDDKGPAAPILKLFNGISSLLCFMFIFLNRDKAKKQIKESYGQPTSGVGGAITGLGGMLFMV